LSSITNTDGSCHLNHQGYQFRQPIGAKKDKALIKMLIDIFWHNLNPNAVAIKSNESYLCKICSALKPTILVKLMPGNQY
jgi:hypothetical protein